jgi:DNA adenine methylase
MRPPVPYFGGKITLAPRIAALLPAHEHYVEPYCGSLAVLLAKPRSRMETVSDLDGQLMAFWRVLRDRPAELARACALTPHSRAEHDQAYDLDGCGELETARRVFVQLSQGRSGTRLRTGWRHYVDPAGSWTGMPDYLDGYAGRILAAAERLAGVSLEAQPALELIHRYGRSPGVLLYVDPPYLGSTRNARTLRGGEHYGRYAIEMPTEAEHRELAAALHGCAAAVVLSGYASSLYDAELYADWHRQTFPARTGQGDAGPNRVEVVWSNRPPHEAYLFDALGAS